jgi:hypothetical protein
MNTCARVNSDGSVRFTVENWAGGLVQDLGASPTPHQLASAGVVASTPCWHPFGSYATSGASAAPILPNNSILNGTRPQDWNLSISVTSCSSGGGGDSGGR